MRVASSADHSTSSVWLRASETEAWIASSTAFGPICSLCFMCTGLVEMKVWMRPRRAGLIASAQRSISLAVARARPQMVDSVTSSAMRRTASKSPLEAIGKPASMTSTPISSRILASSSFSSSDMEAPGDCSPSRMVVSNMTTRSLASAVAGAVMFKVLRGAFGEVERSPWTPAAKRAARRTPRGS